MEMTAFVSQMLTLPLQLSATTLGIEFVRTSKCKNTLGDSSTAHILFESPVPGPPQLKAASEASLLAITF